MSYDDREPLLKKGANGASARASGSASRCPALSPGDYAPATEEDLRSPCPFVNAMANHGYIPRSGRNVHANELQAAATRLGLSTPLAAVFAKPIFLLYENPAAGRVRSFLSRLWYVLRNPWALLAKFGMRKPGQRDEQGRRVLNLDQLALPGVVEHDISLTRYDFAQGDNLTRRPELVKALLECSRDGKIITIDDLAALRRERIRVQNIDNPTNTYESPQNSIACTEIALILTVFGDGKSITVERARAIFQEERLPVREGWTIRKWWLWQSLGFRELAGVVKKVTKAVGPPERPPAQSR